ncbi:MAG TPA: hypothetical protein VFZ23_01295 [Pyrinomonadaceae bacterium]
MYWKSVGIVTSLLLAIAAVSNVWSQRSVSKFSDWGPLAHLPPPINSEYDDQAAVLTKDETTMYFSSNRPGSINGSRDIWVSTRKNRNAPWREPVNLGPVVNSAGTELVRSITSDGHILLFQSDRVDGGFGQADIWAVYRKHTNDDFGWSAPVNLGEVINTPYTELASNYLFADGGRVRKLFISTNKPGGFGGPDIYESTISDSGFETSLNVFELNTPSIETCFWIRDDGLEIIFSSNRPNLTEDRSFDDLWVATRDSVHDPWSAAVNLGPNVNSPGYRDVGPFVTFDGRTLLTSSTRPGGMAPGTFDIYMTTRRRIGK